MKLKNLVRNFLKTKDQNELLKDNILFVNFNKVKNKNKGSCKIINIKT